jgi:RNA polymerase sigma-70 factor (ECF subfamily)
MTGCNDDNSLIEACRAGRTEAFGVLIQRYQDRLYPTMLRLTGDAEDALDLLQDAFLRAFEKLDRFHGDSSFYTWVYRIGVNLALSGRRRRRIIVRSRGGTQHDPAEVPDDLEQSDPTLPIERREREDRVQKALDSLAPDHRAVVVMKEFDGLRYEEIAAILNVPVGTVRSRLHRARLELREKLMGVAAEERASPASARHAARPVLGTTGHANG